MKDRFPHSFRLAAVSAVILALFLIVSGCGQEGKRARREKVVPVTVVPVAQEDVAYTLNAVGNVEPLASVEVKPRVGGIIVKQWVRNGQDVEQGDPLFQIDARPYDLTIQKAQAELDRDRARLEKARKSLKRYSRLRDLNVVAQEQYDDNYAETTALENTIRLNESVLAKARLDREYAAITAPISGRVGIVHVNKGNVIKANDDRTLCVINQIRPINVAFSLPERYLPELMERFSLGEVAVSVLPSGSQDKPVMARVSAVDNAVDTATGTIRVLASHDNQDNRLWPGQFSRVKLVLRTLPKALLLPTRAILPGLKGPYVYVVRPGKDGESGVAEARDVKTSYIVQGRTVVEQGLKPGELVVLDGQIALAPGTRVSIKDRPDEIGGTAGQERAQ